MAQANKQKIPVGFVLSGKYRVTREIGRGGMAAVYEAENVDIGKRVAIKVLAQELTSSAVVVERFLREARAAAAIRSPYICDVYDSGRLEDGRPFLVLELLEGESLYERMTKVRQLDVTTTLQVVTQTCRGLTKAHAASIVHRDLKPENIFLTKDEEGHLLAKILDFGLAKFYAPVDPGEKQARLTREGAVFGTPAYMSPEQVRGQGAVDHRADLWALGCITYECLTGKTVWATEQGVAMTFAQIASSPIPNPMKLRPDLPPGFLAWFQKALDRTIEKRFQSAKEFAEELAAVFQHGPPSFSAIHTLESLTVQPSVDFENETTTRKLPAGAPAAPKPPPPPDGGDVSPASTKPKVESDVPVFVSDPGSGPGSARGSKVGFVAPGPHASSDPSARNAPLPPPSGRAARTIVIVGAAALLGSAGYAGWRQFVQPTTPSLSTASAAPADAGPPATASAAPPDAGVKNAPSMPWSPQVADAQGAIANGDLKGAAKLLKEAYDKGGHGVPRTLLDQVGIALGAEQAHSPCRLTGLARPRTYDLRDDGQKPVASGPPSIAVGPRGPVIVWTDAHDGSEHAYAALLDSAMRVASGPFDVTPEGNAIGRPELTAVEGKLVLTYWDAKGPEAGVHVRWLDADGRIAGPQVTVAPSKGGNFWPSLARATDGSFYVMWSDDGDANSEDLFLRHLSSALEPQGEAVRTTDLAMTGGSKPRARYPSLAIWGDAIHVAFRLEREPDRLIEHMRLPLADADKKLGPPPKNARLADRFTGDAVLVNTDRAKSDGPSLSCSAGSCALAWEAEGQRGAWASWLDATKAQPLWRKKLAKTGMHPAVALAPGGQGELVWFEGGKVVTASIGRDGIGLPTKFARVTGEQPMPSITASGKAGEWYLAWLDYEAGHLEPYAARVVCR